MIYILIVTLGLSIKLLDNCCDERLFGGKNSKWIMSFVVSIFYSVICMSNPKLNIVGLSIALGCFLTGKCDDKSYILSLISVFIVSILNIKVISNNIVALGICSVGFGLDEILNDKIDSYIKNSNNMKAEYNRVLMLLAKSRVIAKITCLILSILFMDKMYFLFCILHDIGYHAMSIVLKKYKNFNKENTL